ncbi:MAG TPA: ABC transporter permease [Vicinamibacterales bacterium]|nr:ABC transporter permease [Vicinamibacterales bacterium]
MTESSSVRTGSSRSPGILQRVSRLQRRAPVLQSLVLVLLFLYGTITISGFAMEGNVRSMLVIASLLALASLGQTLVIILGGLDLSIPGFIVFGAVAVTELFGSHGWPSLAAIVAVVLAAAALGALTGWICHTYWINPLIVTLGMGGVVAGGMLAWTGGSITGTGPAFLTTLTSPAETTFGIPVAPVVAITLGVAILVAVALYRSRSGRRLYATGANPRAAALARINTQTIWMAVFALSAVCSTLVGVLLVGFSGADQSLGDPYLFQGLTAVIVGGTTIMGARGDFTHTVVGALILTVLTTIFVGNDISEAAQQIIFGVLLLVVVASYGREARLRDRV